METLINLKPSELNASVLDTLKRMAVENNVSSISILFNNGEKKKKNSKKEYKEKLDTAIKNIEGGENLVSFTWNEFEALSNSLLRK